MMAPLPQDAARYLAETDIYLEVEHDEDGWLVWEHDRDGGVEQVDAEQPTLTAAIDIASERRAWLAARDLTATLVRPPWHRQLHER